MVRGAIAKVAVIGAGVAGLTCARTLAARGISVRLFEKARGPGGRISTRRHGGLTFDHGAPHFTARGRTMRDLIAPLCATGDVAPWQPRLAPDGRPAWGEETVRWVGVPRMSSVARRLADGIEVQPGVRIREIRRSGAAWELRDDGGASRGRYDAVVVSAPAPQTAQLLAPFPTLAEPVAHVDMEPCWVLMAAWDRPISVGWDVARTDGDLAWIARSTAKPGRDHRETWVVHASAAWSARHIEEDPAAVTEYLASELARLFGAAAPEVKLAHRWRYALVKRPVGQLYLFDEELALGACGDWCLGPRVESAVESGAALGQRLGLAAASLAEVPGRTEPVSAPSAR